MAGYWPSSFFCVFMDRDEVEVHKLAKKGTRPISSHLDQTNLVNKGFIIWLLGEFCLQDTAGSPERARWLHLARSGSQSQRAIWFILSARGASHIINITTDFLLPLCSNDNDDIICLTRKPHCKPLTLYRTIGGWGR